MISDTSNWLLPPKLDGWYLCPSVKWDVKKSDFEYENELFAPILSVMCADNLAEAVELVNGTAYGLTSGLESLDEDEINYWKQHIQAGNLYVNRPTTGAIVQRQPFGGIKQSCFGFGMKAGDVNYLTQFVQVQKSTSYFTKSLDISRWNNYNEFLSEEDKYDLAFAESDYKTTFKTLFEHPNEEIKLRGQHNNKHYLLPADGVVLCVDEFTDLKSILLVEEICKNLKCALNIYQLDNLTVSPQLQAFSKDIMPIQYNELIALFHYDIRFRILARQVSTTFREAATEKAIHLYDQPVLPFGRYEFLNYLTEQSISHNYHRYGNLMGRE